MKRRSFLLAVLLGLALVTGLAVAASSHRVQAGPVYSVAAVRAHLDRDPRTWVGRVVLVRALAEPCPWWGALSRPRHCAGQQLVLVGTPAEPPAPPLPLVPLAPRPLRSFVRGLPILGDVLPRPRPVSWSAPARFRVRLLVSPAATCSAAPCYEALLLDAAPGAR
jgi:hypothetical protein